MREMSEMPDMSECWIAGNAGMREMPEMPEMPELYSEQLKWETGENKGNNRREKTGGGNRVTNRGTNRETKPGNKPGDKPGAKPGEQPADKPKGKTCENKRTNLHSEKQSLTPLRDNIYFLQNGTRQLCRVRGGFEPILSEKIVRFCCIHQ